MNIENISKINNKEKTLEKLDLFLNIAIIINLIITSIAKFIEKTKFFPEIDPSPLFNTAIVIAVVILPVTILIKHLINIKIKKLRK